MLKKTKSDDHSSVSSSSNLASSTQSPQQLIILAAGMGSRIRAGGADRPKPLVLVQGVPLLKRSILTGVSAGVQRFVVVLGYEADLIKEYFADDEELAALEITWVHHERYTLNNGVSVLQAQPYISGEFYLTMADHVLDPDLYHALGEGALTGDLALAVDYKLQSIFDMDDATKVGVGAKGEILEIHKELTDYNAVDTGVFRCNEQLFHALEAVYRETGNASLSQGVKILADQERAYVVDIGDAWWQDVDDLATHAEAERSLKAQAELHSYREDNQLASLSEHIAS